MRIMVLGLRGFPNIQGGVEKHAEQLYPKLTALGCDVEVLGRSPFLSHAKNVFNHVRITRLFSPPPRYKGFEALVHTFLGCLYAGLKRPDILHIHAVGPALLTPLARLMGLRVVVTHHGFDYQREKWNAVARHIIQLGERLGMQFANNRIAVSDTIKDHVEQKYGLRTHSIPNGVTIAAAADNAAVLSAYDLQPDRYFLMVSRFVPEKRQSDLIEAFESAPPDGWKLVLVGDLTPRDAYIDKIRRRCQHNPRVVLTGFQSGDALNGLYRHAGAFVLPSTHEGLPIVILEALSHGVPVIASDIAPNLEIGLPQASYFPAGNIRRLADKLAAAASHTGRGAEKAELLELAARYSWETIAEKTFLAYRQSLEGAPAIARLNQRTATRRSPSV